VAVAKKGARPVAKAGRGKGTDAKKSKTYRLSEAKIAAAQRILGTRTATAAIEAALDLVVFREELLVGTAALLGTELAPFDRDRA